MGQRGWWQSCWQCSESGAIKAGQNHHPLSNGSSFCLFIISLYNSLFILPNYALQHGLSASNLF